MPDEMPSSKMLRWRSNYRGGVRRPDGTHGTPRRYSLRTIFLVTTCLAASLAALRGLGTPSILLGNLLLLVLMVGTAQALFFGGRYPRQASLVGGLLWGVVLAVFLGVQVGPRTEVFMGMLCIVVVSPLLGYLSGGVVAGTFLVLDGVERLLRRPSPTEITDDEN
jgi:hypothetical protein